MADKPDKRNTWKVKNYGYLSNPEYYKAYAKAWQTTNKAYYKKTQRAWYQRNKARIALKGIYNRMKLRKTPMNERTLEKIHHYSQIVFSKHDGVIDVWKKEPSNKYKIEWTDNYKEKKRQASQAYHDRRRKEKGLEKRTYKSSKKPTFMTDEDKIKFFDDYRTKEREYHKRWEIENQQKKVESLKEQVSELHTLHR